MSTRPELTDLPGIPEAVLAQALVAALPAHGAPAPWECRCTGLVWLGRGGHAARTALPPALRGRRPLATLGGLVRYQHTPVGQYDEVFGLVASRTGPRPWGSVGFMAVDSPASLVGGRTNWAMPKTLATFSGVPASGMTATATDGPAGTGWTVRAEPRVLGPAIPWRSRASVRQEFADGRVGSSRLELRARLRPALVTVAVRSQGSLGSWLRSGRHLGAVVESATFTLGAPAFEG